MQEQMKTTAPWSSVGADEGQPSSQITGISITDHSEIFNPRKEISTVSKGMQGQAGGPCALPQALRDSGLFCCWRYEERNGSRTKVPYDPRTSLRARSNEPVSFCGFEQAVQARGYDGVGIGMFHGICAIDMDDCVADDGRFSETAQTIINLMHSYTEFSPSGKGIHILFAAPDFHYDSGTYYIMNHSAGIEVYVAGATSKYVTVTGKVCAEFDYGDRTAELQQLLERFMVKPGSLLTRIRTTTSTASRRRIIQSAMGVETQLLKSLKREMKHTTIPMRGIFKLIIKMERGTKPLTAVCAELRSTQDTGSMSIARFAIRRSIRTA